MATKKTYITIKYGIILDCFRVIKPKASVLYVGIAIYADSETGKCNPTFPDITRVTGLNRHKIREAIDILYHAGLIDIEVKKAQNRKGEEIGRKRYFYTLTYPANAKYNRRLAKSKAKQRINKNCRNFT